MGTAVPHYKITVTVPFNGGGTAWKKSEKDLVRASPAMRLMLQVLRQEGKIGRIGDYNAVFRLQEAVGGFTPNRKATPTRGKAGRQEMVSLLEFSVFVERERIRPLKINRIIARYMNSIAKEHPYEEPVIELAQVDLWQFRKADAGRRRLTL